MINFLLGYGVRSYPVFFTHSPRYQMKFLVLAGLTACGLSLAAQSSEALAVEAEGRALYAAEMASWYGTDLFMEKYPDRTQLGGYFSYASGSQTLCLFYSNALMPRVLGTVAFDSTFDTRTAVLDFTSRDFSDLEQDLYEIRSRALDEMNRETLYKTYQNTNPNLIPLIRGDVRKVYILTAPTQHGVVIFGNDYLLTFDANNQLVHSTALHQDLIAVRFDPDNAEEVLSFHTHAANTSELITATDICTLMLYSRFTQWKQHSVVSKKYISIWNCQTQDLVVLTHKALKRIQKHQQQHQQD
ncbi:MAG: hypothetical protein SF053_14070 [Bacteroidia bacterium]|nr:hypothetical protein [Bacteroidia bacterium]